MNQQELQTRYQELSNQLSALPLSGMATVIERNRLNSLIRNLKELSEFNSLELLRQCPFCGTFNVECENQDQWYVVQCQGCEAEGPPEKDRHAAMAAWNKRST